MQRGKAYSRYTYNTHTKWFWAKEKRDFPFPGGRVSARSSDLSTSAYLYFQTFPSFLSFPLRPLDTGNCLPLIFPTFQENYHFPARLGKRKAYHIVRESFVPRSRYRFPLSFSIFFIHYIILLLVRLYFFPFLFSITEDGTRIEWFFSLSFNAEYATVKNTIIARFPRIFSFVQRVRLSGYGERNYAYTCFFFFALVSESQNVIQDINVFSCTL